MASERRPVAVQATAPVRVCDAGGWTDTWFAKRGQVCNVAVGPAVTVSAAMAADGVVAVELPALGDAYSYVRSDVRGRAPGRHRLLEAAVEHLAPAGAGLRLRIEATVPPGSGLGTSAAVLVATAAALRALRGTPVEPAALAAEAHRLETVDAGREAGVQDHFAAALGGASLLSIGRYPFVSARSLVVPPATLTDLGRRLVTVYLGVPHASADVHRAVIAALAGTDGERRLRPLREAAAAAAGALEAGDLDGYGAALIANTEAQAQLHPEVVGHRARAVIELARDHSAPGWKVNGAGGDGGSVTVLAPEPPERLRAALAAVPDLELLELAPVAEGVRVEAD
jgi:D-glycero-alpha-D-manno-heptose-7-phosphate kinase